MQDIFSRVAGEGRVENQTATLQEEIASPSTADEVWRAMGFKSIPEEMVDYSGKRYGDPVGDVSEYQLGNTDQQNCNTNQQWCATQQAWCNTNQQWCNTRQHWCQRHH